MSGRFEVITTNSGYLFTAFVNGRFVSEFVSRDDAKNLGEAIDLRVERLGY